MPSRDDTSYLTSHPARLVLSLSLSLAVGIGFGRFGYALVLPDMRDSLGWSYSTAGLMNTMNAAGYLGGALVASKVVRRFGAYRTVWIGMLISMVSMVLSSLSGDAVIFSVARVLAGIGGAQSLIAGGALTVSIAQANPSRGALLLGLFYVGPAIGVIVSGLVSPFILEAAGAGTWWLVWSVLSAIGLVFTLMLHQSRVETPVAAQGVAGSGVPLRPVLPYLASYFLFGAGYIAYMTFMIAYVRDAGGGAVAQSLLWCAIGAGGIISPLLWRKVIARGQSGVSTALLLVVTMISAGLPMFGQSSWMLPLSALAFGSVFFAVTTATTAFVRFNYPPAAWPQAIAVLTITFSLGQTLGPIVTGALTDVFGSLSYALVASAALLGVGAVAAVLQRPLLTPEEVAR